MNLLDTNEMDNPLGSSEPALQEYSFTAQRKVGIELATWTTQVTSDQLNQL